MAAAKQKVLIYEQDQQTAGHIEFGARQFDLVPLRAARREEAQRCIDEGAIDIAFVSTSLPGLNVPPQICAVQIVDDSSGPNDLLSASALTRVLLRPASIFEVMAILKNILDPGASESADYTFHMLQSRIVLRTLKLLLPLSQDRQRRGLSLKDSLYQFCVGQCPRALTAEASDNTDQSKYKLLTVSLRFGKRQCAFLDDCKLHLFSGWLQEHHCEVLESRPQDVFPALDAGAQLDKLQANLDVLLASYDAAVQRLYALKKDFCSHRCGQAVNGTEFKEGDVLISEWSDIFRNECIYCPHADCPLNQFFKLIVYQCKTA